MSGLDCPSAWDPNLYENHYYGENALSSDAGHPLQAKLDNIADIYSKGKVKGQTLLDFGTGPTIWSLVSASRHVDNIYVSDFVESNRDTLWQWANNDAKALDNSHIFAYLNKKENTGLSTAKRQNEMRSKIKGVLHCDFKNKNPLFPSIFPKFDVITSSFCVSVTPEGTLEAYEFALKNVLSLLKPGGWFVYVDTIGASRYEVGDQQFVQVTLTKELAYEVLARLGLRVEIYHEFKRSVEQRAKDPTEDSTGEFYLAARKL